MAGDNSNPLNLNPAHFSEPKRNSVFSSLFLVFLITALVPLGVYLVGQRTDLIPQATTPTPQLGETSLNLDSPKKSLSVGEEFTVQVYLKSGLESSNLISTKINFPKDSLEVKSVNINPTQKTDISYFLKKWLDSSFDNNSGQINLVATIPSPGLVTKLDQNYLLSEITFKSKSPGIFKIEFDNQNSSIFSTKDNLNILKNKDPLDLQIDGGVAVDPTESSPSAQTLELTSPQGGAAYLYSSVVPVTWQSNGVGVVQISLLRNDELQGHLATAEAKLGQFEFIPSKTISQSLTKPLNSFKLRISSLDQKLASESKGPFEILNLQTLPQVATDA